MLEAVELFDIKRRWFNDQRLLLSLSNFQIKISNSQFMSATVAAFYNLLNSRAVTPKFVIWILKLEIKTPPAVTFVFVEILLFPNL